MLEEPAKDTVLNTSFLSVAEHPTIQCSAAEQQRVSLPQIGQSAGTYLLKISRHRPLTSAKVNRLKFLLHGYPPSLKRYLNVSAFWGSEALLCPLNNLKSTLQQPRILQSSRPGELLVISLTPRSKVLCVSLSA